MSPVQSVFRFRFPFRRFREVHLPTLDLLAGWMLHAYAPITSLFDLVCTIMLSMVSAIIDSMREYQFVNTVELDFTAANVYIPTIAAR